MTVVQAPLSCFGIAAMQRLSLILGLFSAQFPAVLFELAGLVNGFLTSEKVRSRLITFALSS